jgi:hypothetical protein
MPTDIARIRRAFMQVLGLEEVATTQATPSTAWYRRSRAAGIVGAWL